VYDADETALTTFIKKPEKWYGEKKHRRFCQFEVRREEPLQLSEVSALRPVVTYRTARACEDFKREDTARFFWHSTQRTVMSTMNIISKKCKHYCTYKRILSFIMLTVHWWKQCSPFMGP
jgi:hypothetical protein